MQQQPLNASVPRQTPARTHVEIQCDKGRVTPSVPRELDADEMRHVSGAGTRLPVHRW